MHPVTMLLRKKAETLNSNLVARVVALESTLTAPEVKGALFQTTVILAYVSFVMIMIVSEIHSPSPVPYVICVATFPMILGGCVVGFWTCLAIHLTKIGNRLVPPPLPPQSTPNKEEIISVEIAIKPGVVANTTSSESTELFNAQKHTTMMGFGLLCVAFGVWSCAILWTISGWTHLTMLIHDGVILLITVAHGLLPTLDGLGKCVREHNDDAIANHDGTSRLKTLPPSSSSLDPPHVRTIILVFQICACAGSAFVLLLIPSGTIVASCCIIFHTIVAVIPSLLILRAKGTLQLTCAIMFVLTNSISTLLAIISHYTSPLGGISHNFELQAMVFIMIPIYSIYTSLMQL